MTTSDRVLRVGVVPPAAYVAEGRGHWPVHPASASMAGRTFDLLTGSTKSMDLYKYAMWFQPLVGSELAADCFDLARTARELDMRASPYDCSEFGLDPIRVETPEGRREYATLQQSLMTRTGPIRAAPAGVLTRLRPATI